MAKVLTFVTISPEKMAQTVSVLSYLIDATGEEPRDDADDDPDEDH